jgi:membrane-bound serine protease (ClpP class)
MKKRFARLTLALYIAMIAAGLVILLDGGSITKANSGGPVYLCKIEGVIGPVSTEFYIETLREAEAEMAECLIVELDTPGGLDISMRDAIKEMMASDVPTVVYVHPSGSRAASAGAFLLIASHVAAMAPGTNVGAAHPVQMGGGEIDSTMGEKITNDAAAYIRSIADQRGRNAEWAEDAVRNSISSTADEALEAGVIDLISPNLVSLLDDLEGMEVETASGTRTLNVKDADVKHIHMGAKHRFLSAIADPNIAYILMMIGFFGLFFELSNPGAIFPGIAGSICIIVAFYALHTLSANYAGVALIILAMIMFLLEIKVTSYGGLTLGAVISLLLGSILLFDYPTTLLRVSWSVLIPAVTAITLFFVFVVGKGISAQRRRPATGGPALLDQIGEARSDIDSTGGTIFVSGEHWNAVSDVPISKGQKVRVLSVDRQGMKVSPV